MISTMPSDILAAIRTVINDEGSSDFTTAEIDAAYWALNENFYTVTGYLKLAQASQLVQPTAPTIPTLEDYPEASFAMWKEKTTQAINLFQQELALYREERAQVQSQADILKAQAQLFIDVAKGGDIL